MQYRALSNFNSYKQAFCLWVRTLCVPGWSYDCFVLSVSVCLHIYAYHMHSNYVTYVVAMQLYLDQLDDCFEFWCSYYEWHSCEFEILRSRGNVDARITESGNARSEQLFVMPTEQLTNCVQ